ncbi:TAP-like protein [Paraburkholderia bryophila]|uniref:TAP-like protein n=2 Tax=Paraburkholderia bryophila TaxID=420952 RepID=A0A329D0R5_9BURK|nr:TAP-like protein [Paraburkholderia bryophila]
MKIVAMRTAWIVSTVALAGCGGEDAPPSGQQHSAAQKRASIPKPYLDQKVAWRPCDKNRLPVAWAALADNPRFRCANIRAPMDWGDPEKGEITLALTRVAAKDPATRLGSLLFNPGGPGADGLLVNLQFSVEVAGGGIAAERDMASRYDLIGFSPRGMGSSTQLTCNSDERPSAVLWSGDTRASTVNALLRNVELKSRACQDNPLAPYINTAQMAQDMDLIRAISGDAKLNYIGHSYGSWLGAWYAGLFPDRVGRMVLSGNTDFSARTWAEGGILLQPPATQRIADEIVGPYAARHDTTFNLGTDPAATGQLFRSFSPALKAATVAALGESRGFALSGYIDDAVSVFVAAKGVRQILEQNPGATQERALALARHHVFSSHSPSSEMALEIATQTLIPKYFEAMQQPPREESTLHVNTEEAVDLTVMCNDTPALSTDRQFWIDKHIDYAQRYPLGSGVLGGSVLNFSCLFWNPPQAAAIKPTLDEVARAPSIVMIQAEFDGMTAAEGAVRMFDGLPNASLLYQKNEYSHSGYPSGNPCVDEPVTQYLLHGTPPPRRVDCPQNRALSLDNLHEPEAV